LTQLPPHEIPDGAPHEQLPQPRVSVVVPAYPRVLVPYGPAGHAASPVWLMQMVKSGPGAGMHWSPPPHVEVGATLGAHDWIWVDHVIDGRLVDTEGVHVPPDAVGDETMTE
jgi:hypothetical protein